MVELSFAYLMFNFNVYSSVFCLVLFHGRLNNLFPSVWCFTIGPTIIHLLQYRSYYYYSRMALSQVQDFIKIWNF